MTLAEAVVYAQLLNVLLIPAVIWIVKLERRLVQIAGAVKAHGDLDAEIHAGFRRDVARVEGAASAAHGRMDREGMRPASASP